jgi:hypothetical protein
MSINIILILYIYLLNRWGLVSIHETNDETNLEPAEYMQQARVLLFIIIHFVKQSKIII